MLLKKAFLHLEPNPKFKPQNSQKFGIATQIHLVPSLTSSAQRSSFLHLLSTGPMAHVTLPCCRSQEHRWHLTPGRGAASGPAELQTLGELRAKSNSREALTFFSLPCVLYKLSCLSLDLLKLRLDYHLKSQNRNPAKGLLATQECSFNRAC